MDIPATPSRVSRVDSRHRRRALFEIPDRGAHHQPQPQDEEPRARSGRDTMAKDHRPLHRRVPQAPTEVVTVSVEVVATVDSQGNLISQETITPGAPAQPTPVVPVAVPAVTPAVAPAAAPAVIPAVVPAAEVPSLPIAAPAAVDIPSVASAVAPVIAPVAPVASVLQIPSVPQAVASVLAVPSEPLLPQVLSLPQVPAVPTVAAPSMPVVPSVPPFPSDLLPPSVPAFPFSSEAAVAQALAAATSAVSLGAPASSAAAIPSGSSPITSSIAASSPSATSLPSAQDVSGQSSSSAAQFSSQTGSGIQSALSTRTSTGSETLAATVYGGGGGQPGGLAAPTSGASTEAQDNGPITPLETPQVVGSVVGSLAGAALILAIILLLLRRHKRRRGGALQLTDNDRTDNDRSMREAPPRPARASIIPSAFLHRFSGMSRSTAETSLSGGERSFQRVSGRKLPSAFSDGMTSDQFSRGGTMSESSFYQDDQGIYGGPGLAKEFGKEIGDSPKRESGQMSFRPGPARTPMIRNPDDPFSDVYRSHLSPPQSPNPMFPPRGTLGRSLPSADGSRSSRFTENV